MRSLTVCSSILAVSSLCLAVISGCGDDATSTGSGGGSTGDTTSSGGGTTGTMTTTTGTTGTGTTTGGGGAAPVNDFTCLGDPLPTTAPAMITLSGSTQSIGLSGFQALGTVALEVFDANDASLATTTSDAGGVFSVMAATGGLPIDGYLQGVKASYLDTFVYPPFPLAADVPNTLIPFLTPGTFGILQNLVSETQTAGNGFAVVILLDCADDPIGGATVSSTPAGTVKYNGANGAPNAGATSTGPDGIAYVFNLTAGDVELDAMAGTNDLREHTINARADVITATIIRP